MSEKEPNCWCCGEPVAQLELLETTPALCSECEELNRIIRQEAKAWDTEVVA